APWGGGRGGRRISRRGFLRIGGTALAGVLGGAPASWAARELGILTAVNYAPTSDAQARRARQAVRKSRRRQRPHQSRAERTDAGQALVRAHGPLRPRHHDPRDPISLALSARAGRRV